MKKVIMAIGAHADDVELRSGGTLAKYHEMGYEVVYVLATNNTAGAHTSQTALEHATQRRNEAREGAQILNAEPVYLDFKETMFEKRGDRERLGFQTVDLSDYPEWGRDKPPIICAQDLDEAVEEVAALLRRYEPEIVLTHSPTEKHEHWATCVLALKAFKKARQSVKLGTLYAWADSGTGTVSISGLFSIGCQQPHDGWIENCATLVEEGADTVRPFNLSRADGHNLTAIGGSESSIRTSRRD